MYGIAQRKPATDFGNCGQNVLRENAFREARRLESSVEAGGVAAGHLLGTVLPLDKALGLDAEIVKVLLVKVRVRLGLGLG